MLRLNLHAILVKFHNYRCHHSAWTNGCDTLTVVGLHENWTWSNSGIQGLRNLGIEEILSILIY